MLGVGKQRSGVKLGRRLLRGLSRREVLMTSTIHARVPRPLVSNQSGTAGTTTTSVLCGSKVTSSGTTPNASGVRRGKASMARPSARPPRSSSSPKRSRSAYPEQDDRDDPCVCHP